MGVAFFRSGEVSSIPSLHAFQGDALKSRRPNGLLEMGQEGSCPQKHENKVWPMEGNEATLGHRKVTVGYSRLGFPVEERAAWCVPCCYFPGSPRAGPLPSLGCVSPCGAMVEIPFTLNLCFSLWHLNSPVSLLLPVLVTCFYNMLSSAVNSQAVLFVSRQVTLSLHTQETEEMLIGSPESSQC